MTKQSIKQPAVYIMANRQNGTLYTGVTSNLIKRVHEHKEGKKSGFAHKYGCNTLVYYMVFDDMEHAILEEKRIKGGNREKKITLIENMNPEWADLSSQLTL